MRCQRSTVFSDAPERAASSRNPCLTDSSSSILLCPMLALRPSRLLPSAKGTGVTLWSRQHLFPEPPALFVLHGGLFLPDIVPIAGIQALCLHPATFAPGHIPLQQFCHQAGFTPAIENGVMEAQTPLEASFIKAMHIDAQQGRCTPFESLLFLFFQPFP